MKHPDIRAAFDDVLKNNDYISGWINYIPAKKPDGDWDTMFEKMKKKIQRTGKLPRVCPSNSDVDKWFLYWKRLRVTRQDPLDIQ